MNRLAREGWDLFPTAIAAAELDALRDTAFTHGEAGTRCRLDLPVVRQVAIRLRSELAAAGHLRNDSPAIQAIAFDKTPGANWKVTWHQDVMFPFARPVTTPGFDLPSQKDGFDYARPPRDILENLLAVRLHIDDCDDTNGPLRVAPGSHRLGILKSTAIPGAIQAHGEHACLARRGEALLMKPLALHASSPASSPRHRRVLHVVYYSGPAFTESWYRAV
jgi:hypothetical protein